MPNLARGDIVDLSIAFGVVEGIFTGLNLFFSAHKETTESPCLFATDYEEGIQCWPARSLKP